MTMEHTLYIDALDDDTTCDLIIELKSLIFI